VSNKHLRLQATIGRHAQDRIGRELRAMYSEVLREPLPEDLLSVLQAFQDAETAQQRLQKAVEELRRNKMAFALNLDGLSGASLVHAQQRQIALAVRALRPQSTRVRSSRSQRIPGKGAAKTEPVVSARRTGARRSLKH